MVYKIK